MASEEHLRMSTTIKDVHRRLRDRVRNGECFKEVWKEHLSDETILKEYAECMKNLATNHWTKLESADEETSRISWVYAKVMHYFKGPGRSDQLAKDLRRLDRHEDHEKVAHSHSSAESTDTSMKLKLLDVGSCYNPFSAFSEFEVTAIDIAPAVESVHKLDFLAWEPHKQSDSGGELQLSRNEFDVVVFCLLLEYLPTKEARLRCCENALELLKENGILVIITPDSCHATRNSQLYKGWKTALQQIGYQRVCYEKLQHFHGMVFRKLGELQKELCIREAETELNMSQIIDLMAIPQDRNNGEQNENSAPENLDRENIIEDFSSLPCL